MELLTGLLIGLAGMEACIVAGCIAWLILRARGECA